MFSYLKGIIQAKDEEGVVLENSGIGFAVSVPQGELERLRVGDAAQLFTHFALREDGVQLYGFLSRDDLSFFKMLLLVSGIGPKGALGILSAMSADDLRFSILAGDAAALAKAPGIGKKTAQKIILELRDKLDLEEAFEMKTAHKDPERGEAFGDPQREAVLALEVLGYAPANALKAVQKAATEGRNTDVEELLKAALKEL